MKILAFLLGACALWCEPFYMSFISLALLFVLAGMIFCYSKTFSYCVFGFIWAVMFAQTIAAKPLPSSCFDQAILLRGVVASVPSIQLHREQFDLIAKIHDKKRLIRLTRWGRPMHLTLGQKVRLWAQLKTLKGKRFGLSYAHYLWSQGIAAQGVLLPHQDILFLGKAKLPFLYCLRANLQKKLYAALGNNQISAVISGMVLGLRSNINQATKRAFQNTGTAHMLAISGLHVGMLATMVYVLVGLLMRFSPRLCLVYPAPKMAAAITLIIAFIYVCIAGFPVSAIRAYIMLSCVMIYQLFNQRLQAWRGFSLALVLILLFNPMSVLQAGFWLSFMAVFIILLTMSGRLKVLPRWRQVIQLQFAITLLMAPFSLVLFHHVSLLSPCVNIVAIPYVSIFVMPAALLGVALLMVLPALAAVLLKIAAFFLKGLIVSLNLIGAQSWQLMFVTPSLLVGVQALFILFIFFTFFKKVLNYR